MTTAYHNVGITSQQIVALMRRINALEEAGYNRYMGVQLRYPHDSGGTTLRDWRIGEDGYIYALYDDGSDIRIEKYNLNAELIRTSSNLYGTGTGQIRDAFWGITADSSGNVYVLDRGSGANSKIVKYNSSFAYSTEWEPNAGGTLWTAVDIQCRGSKIYCAGYSIASVYEIPEFPFLASTYDNRISTYNLTGGAGAVLLSEEHDDPLSQGISVHENGYFWVDIDGTGAQQSLYDDTGEYVRGPEVASVGPNSIRVALGIDNTYWKYGAAADPEIAAYIQFDLEGNETGLVRPYSFDTSKIGYASRFFCDTGGAIHGVRGGGPYPVDGWMKYGHQTYFSAYTPDAVSLGTPDGGNNSPALNALSPTVTAGSLLAAQIIEDMREAIEALAPFYKNAVTGDPFNWTDADVDNLYSKAVDTTDYGDSGVQYDWHRTKAQMYDQFPVARDIGEIEDCVTLLEASDLV